MGKLFKNVVHDACNFDRVSLKISTFNVLFWEGGTGSQKIVCCERLPLLVILTIMDDP